MQKSIDKITRPFRGKTLDGILATFHRASDDLDAYIKAKHSDIAATTGEIDKLSAERTIYQTQAERADRIKGKIQAITA